MDYCWIICLTTWKNNIILEHIMKILRLEYNQIINDHELFELYLNKILIYVVQMMSKPLRIHHHTRFHNQHTTKLNKVQDYMEIHNQQKNNFVLTINQLLMLKNDKIIIEL
jgi:hypothetical protein